MKYSDFLLDEQFNINNVIYRFKNKINGKVYIGQTAVPFRKRVIQHITCSNPIYQYDLNGNFIKKWDSYKDVTLILYGLHKGNLSRNIKLNIQKNKLGFTKNGSIWSTISPTERRSYY